MLLSPPPWKKDPKNEEKFFVHLYFDRFLQLVADINSGIIFLLLPMNVFTLGSSMYTMEHVKIYLSIYTHYHKNCLIIFFLISFWLPLQSEFDLDVFPMDVLCLVCSLMWSFLFCYFANVATDHVSDIGDVAYNNLNWFEHPVDMQKYLILIVARSHERVDFTGVHLIVCSIEVFGKVRQFIKSKKNNSLF